MRDPVALHPFQNLVLSVFLNFSIRFEVIAHDSFTYSFTMTSNADHLYIPAMCHLYVFFGEVSKTFAHFLFELFAFLLLGLEFSSYILDANFLRNVQLENIFF